MTACWRSFDSLTAATLLRKTLLVLDFILNILCRFGHFYFFHGSLFKGMSQVSSKHFTHLYVSKWGHMTKRLDIFNSHHRARKQHLTRVASHAAHLQIAVVLSLNFSKCCLYFPSVSLFPLQFSIPALCVCACVCV